MKLLLLNYEFPPMGGGASNATFNIALQLVKLGHSVDVLTSRFADQPSEETIKGVKVYRVTSWRHGIHNCGLRGAISYVVFAFFSLRSLLKKNRYDLLHYFFGLPTGLLSLYSHGVKNRPYVLSLRGSDVPGYDTMSLKLRLLHWVLRPITMRIWKKAERLVANSHSLRELALRTLPGQPIRVIYNGIDTDIFKLSPDLNDDSNGHTRLLCVSRLIDRKGLDYLFQAVAEINDPRIRVDIVGTGGGEQRLKSKIRELGLETQVRFWGYKTASELADLYNHADIFILPSLSESLAMVLLEAMSCGLPIIASHVGGIPEVVADGENGILIPPGKVDAIIEAIHRLINDSPLRSRISQNNPIKIREQYTWIKIALKYQAIYDEALKRELSGAHFMPDLKDTKMRWMDTMRIAHDLVFLFRSQWWSEDKILRYQEKQLVRIMKHAVSKVPFYKSLGISPSSIRTAQDLKRFPVVTKQDIQKNGDGFLWPQLKKEDLHVSRTSGTSCEPTKTFFNHRSWLFSKYALKMSRIFSVENPLFKRLLIVSEQTSTNLEEANRSRLKGANILFVQRRLSLFDNADDHIPVLLSYKPHILYAFPSYLLSLIQALEEKHLPCPKIPVIFTSSELLTGKARAQIENRFQARLYDVYGSTEFKEVAWQCRQGRYHINFQNVHLEAEPDGSVKPSGGSRLFISSLTNYAMPLLRFEIGDRAELGRGECPCGRRSPYLRNIYGREADFIRLPNGKRVSPYLLTTTIEAHPAIRKYQIVQKSATELAIEFIAPDEVDTNGISESLSGELRELLDGHIHITFNKVDQIHRSESGKYQIIKKMF